MRTKKLPEMRQMPGISDEIKSEKQGGKNGRHKNKHEYRHSKGGSTA